MARKKGELPLRDRLRRLADWRVVGPVTVEHNNEAAYALASDGSRWVAKSVAVTGPNQFLAEAISYQLAALLQLPVPAGAWGGNGESLMWFSEHVQGVSHFNPMRLPLTTQQADFGRILAFDVWMLNEDRHPGNILMQTREGLFSPCFIDFGSAVVGHPADYTRRVEDVPREGQFAARAVAGELLREGANAALMDVGALRDGDVTDVIDEACHIAGLQSDAPGLSAAVLRRKAGLPSLVRSFLVRLGVSP